MVPSVSFLRITDIILSNFGIIVSNVKKENKFLLSITVFARNHFRLKIENSGQNYNSTFFILLILLHWHKVRHVVMVTSREKISHGSKNTLDL